MDLKTGDIVLLTSSHESSAKNKYRPGLVLHRENISQDVLVGYVSSEVETYIGHKNTVPLKAEDLAEGILKRDTVVCLDKIIVVKPQMCKRVGRLKQDKVNQILRKMAAMVTMDYYYATQAAKKAYLPGDRIFYGGRVYDEKEMINLVDSSLDFWLTAGRYAEKFEKDFSEFLGVKHCSLTNSGSSANLLAFMALTSSRLGDRRIQKGDEVITVAAAFPTTVAPIIQYGAIPVLVDVTLPTYNIDCDLLEIALSPKTKAVILAHTMGNPFDIEAVLTFCQKHNLWLVEDNCDALGSQYRLSKDDFEKESGRSEDKKESGSSCYQYTGSFGSLATFSFYPPHHITMGEGGAVCTHDSQLKRLVESFRDWGRDCWCGPGKDGTCIKRFSQQFGELPYGYDHKYIYSHFGYNLKVTDMQAAIGCAQMEKLPSFIEARRKNFTLLLGGLKDLEEQFILPQATPHSIPSWFGFLLTVREKAGFTRDELVRYLESRNIQTRTLFSGNIIRHPCFDDLRSDGQGYRLVSRKLSDCSSSKDISLASALPVTDQIMCHTFWLGVYPGMTENMIEFIVDSIRKFVKK